VNLYPHQITGADFLAQRGFAFLFDVPGLGKTATAVAACDRVGAQKILVICPAVVRRFWELTFLTWQKIKRDVTCIEGFIKHALPDGVSIISHECLADVAPPPNSKKARRDVYSVPMLWVGAPYDVIVLDIMLPIKDGYAVARSEQGTTLASSTQFVEGQSFTLRLRDGEIDATTRAVRPLPEHP